MKEKHKSESVLFTNNNTEMSVENILRVHSNSYPDMQPIDAVKLLYQAAFGPGHMISDYCNALSRVQQEMYSVSNQCGVSVNNSRFEDIGGGYVRMYLQPNASDKTDARLDTLLFVASANEADDGEKAHSTRKISFVESLNSLKKLTADGVFGFGCDELEEYLNEYIAAGMPAVSHSKEYKNAYSPSYRVIKREYCALYPLIRKIFFTLEQSNGCEKSLHLFIDGMCGSGKTTLAKLLSKLFDARIIHMDDFFLPPAKRTPSRLNEIGGNIDYERFRNEVIDHIDDASLSYGVFDCSKMCISSQLTLAKKPLTIIEGSYACHPHFEIVSSCVNGLRVYMECDSTEQKRRILHRNGEKMLERFVGEWIPMENNYANEYSIKNRADFIIQT